LRVVELPTGDSFLWFSGTAIESGGRTK